MTMAAHPTVAYQLRHWDPGSGRPHVVAGAGEFDLQAAPELRELLTRLSTLGTKHIVVDLSQATFVDSTVLAVVTQHLERLMAEGGSLALVCTNHVRRTIEIAGLDGMLDIHPTLADALAPALS